MESLETRKKRASEIIKLLLEDIPEPKCALIHDTPFQLLVATILSAQCTDERVNKVTPELFKRAPTAQAMAELGLAGIKKYIKSVNFFNNKAANILATSKILAKEYGGDIPHDHESMVKLPGVGRKTANVVLGTAFQIPGVVVDTHVIRLSNRLHLVSSKDPVDIEKQIEKIVIKDRWIDFSHLMVLHGRKTCKALKPQCEICVIKSYCPSKNKNPSAWSKR